MNNCIFKIEPKVSSIKQRLSIQIKNLPADTLVTIKASTKNYYPINADIRKTPSDALWTSYAEFLTDKSGNIDLSKDKPINGTYDYADSMGLIYSMHTSDTRQDQLENNIENIPQMRNYTIDFTIQKDNKIISSQSITRFFCTDDVLSENVNNNLLHGRFFTPNDNNMHAAIIVLSGSDGRLEKAQAIAETLADEGFAALAVCYFGMNDVSESLERIPIEIVNEAIVFLKNKKNILKGKIGIYGRSKGSEMALEAASLYNDITCVNVTSPSCIAYAGITKKSLNSKYSSWSHNKIDIPFLNFRLRGIIKMLIKKMLHKRDALTTLYIDTLSEYEKYIIPIEKINGPIMFISSNTDEVWPSEKYVSIAEKYLKDKNFKYKVYDKHFDYAGHMMTLPYQSIAKKNYISKSLYQYVYGSVNSWKATVDFFKSWEADSVNKN